MICFHREQVELCVDILERILMALSPLHLAQNYRAELQGGLTHPEEIVKILALTQVSNSHRKMAPKKEQSYQVFLVFHCQIGRMVEHAEAATEILNNQEVLRGVIQCIREEKIAVAKQVITHTLSFSLMASQIYIVCALTVLFCRPSSPCPN